LGGGCVWVAYGGDVWVEGVTFSYFIFVSLTLLFLFAFLMIQIHSALDMITYIQFANLPIYHTYLTQITLASIQHI
jgi:hypothetical protein